MTARQRDARASGGPSARRHWTDPPVLLALLAIVASAATAAWLIGSREPGMNEADAGFARDMIAHHEQAVEMAEIARDRSRDPVVLGLAKEIALIQQEQIGRMQGWLQALDLSREVDGPCMAWMDHPVDGIEAMPGMASQEELRRLEGLSPPQFEEAFLRLMIEHHLGGVAMAEAVLERGESDDVRRLAETIVTSQRIEIDVMQKRRQELGFPPVADTITPQLSVAPSAAPSAAGGAHGAGHDAGGAAATSPAPDAAGDHDAMAMGGHDEGFAAAMGPALRETLRLGPLVLALFAAAWLGLDAWRRRASIGADLGGSARTWQIVAVSGLLGSALLHAGLTTEHFDEGAAYGWFFAGATVALSVTAAAVLARPSRPTFLAGATIALGLIALWGLFRIVRVPGAGETESVDLVGLVTKALEAIAAAGCLWLWRDAARSRPEAGAAGGRSGRRGPVATEAV